MSRRFWVIFFIFSSGLFIMVQPHPAYVFGFQPTLSSNPTIPTRTNTPPPNPPTKTPGNGGGGNSTAVPTSAFEPTSTATPTTLITIAFTPVGGFMPTAESCSNQPTAQAQNLTNVRAGPGADYDIVDQLTYLEVRLIIGRAADTTWWLILLDNGATGWVADDVVIVEGYANIVPIVPAPQLNGATPTAGIPWNPTPPLFCTVTPTLTPTATTTMPPPPATATPKSGEETEASTVQPPTATSPPKPTQTAVSPPTLAPTIRPINIAEMATPLPDAPPTTRSTANFLLPAAGVLLLAAGIVTLATKRQKTKES